MGDVAPTVDQHTDLPADLSTQLGQVSGEVVVEEYVRVESPTEESLQLLDLAGLQAAGVAVNLDCGLLGTNGFETGAKTLALTPAPCTRSEFCNELAPRLHFNRSDQSPVANHLRIAAPRG